MALCGTALESCRLRWDGTGVTSKGAGREGDGGVLQRSWKFPHFLRKQMTCKTKKDIETLFRNLSPFLIESELPATGEALTDFDRRVLYVIC